ncbi:helix-turn-helix transcriptional regulator [Oerskovia sp. M15]
MSKDSRDQKIGATIRALREAQGLSQAQVAAALTSAGIDGMYAQTVLKVEKGTRGLKFHEGLELAKVLGVEPGELYDDTPSGADVTARRLISNLRFAKEELSRDLVKANAARGALKAMLDDQPDIDPALVKVARELLGPSLTFTDKVTTPVPPESDYVAQLARNDDREGRVMSSIAKRELPLKAGEKTPRVVWRARYRDADDKEHARHFPRQTDAKAWLDEVTASIVTGTYQDPAKAKITVGSGVTGGSWVRGQQGVHGPPGTHARREDQGGPGEASPASGEVLGRALLGGVLAADNVAPSYVYALHARLAQIMTDAVHDGLIARSPCSRRTSPKAGAQRSFIATTAQVWELHDAMPVELRAAVLLGRSPPQDGRGVRSARPGRRLHAGVIAPAVQYPSQPLKTDESKRPIPIPRELTLELSAHVKAHPSKGRSCRTRSGIRLDRGRSPVRYVMREPLRAFRRSSASTTSATTSRRCSSRRAPT